MTNPIINPQPNYSGVTIQIANPAVYAGVPAQRENMIQNGYVTNPVPYQVPDVSSCQQGMYPPGNIPAAYPPQYYLNNYNYQNNGLDEKEKLAKLEQKLAEQSGADKRDASLQTSANDIDEINKQVRINDGQNAVEKVVSESQGNTAEIPAEQSVAEAAENPSIGLKHYDDGKNTNEVQDFTKSQDIIDDLNAREAEIKEEKKNTKQKRVVALTDEYIKSLENYLNNPNDEIRLMASKEILTRLDEDKERYDDAALNALLNKMLQDPSKLIRISALSAFASQLASGNDYTVTLLQNIQANPDADKEDVLQAADILLKMSGGTEIKYIPNPAVKEEARGGNK